MIYYYISERRCCTEELENEIIKVKKNNNNRTADEVTVGGRCAIPREIYNDIAVIASASKKTNCEIQIEVLREWTVLKKLENECAVSQAQGITNDRCRYINPK